MGPRGSFGLGEQEHFPSLSTLTSEKRKAQDLVGGSSSGGEAGERGLCPALSFPKAGHPPSHLTHIYTHMRTQTRTAQTEGTRPARLGRGSEPCAIGKALTFVPGAQHYPVWTLAPLLPCDLGAAPPTLGLLSSSTRRMASSAHSEFPLRRE